MKFFSTTRNPLLLLFLFHSSLFQAHVSHSPHLQSGLSGNLDLILDSVKYYQSEMVALSRAQSFVASQLEKHGIPTIAAPHKAPIDSVSGDQMQVALSSPSNVIECRISLSRVPLGCKAVSPCKCTGSQKWIRFSVLNRLRRKDPSQWKRCQVSIVFHWIALFLVMYVCMYVCFNQCRLANSHFLLAKLINRRE